MPTETATAFTIGAIIRIGTIETRSVRKIPSEAAYFMITSGYTCYQCID